MLLLTGLFMNGKALGIQTIADPDAETEEGYFTQNDQNGDWSTSGATHITLKGDTATVAGNGAYVQDGDIHIIYAGKYVLSGELTDGSIIIDATNEDKIWLLLDGAAIHCEDSGAIVVEQAKKVFLTLAEGTVNSVSSGESFSQEATSNGIDGAIYSRDDLTINGSGTLTVTAPYKHGIVGNDDLVITGGTIHITAVQDGIHVHDSVRIANADLTIYAGDDGITVSNDENTAWLYVESGNISIPTCYEGLEAIDIIIAGGTIDIRPTDDGINANGRGGIINITGGDITIINETGRDADGLDSNGSIEISGGNIFISVNTSSCALDCGTENGGTCTISGGTVIAAGGSSMAEGFESYSEQAFIMYSATGAAGTSLTLKGESGEVLLSGTIPCAFSNVVLSTPALQLGETVTLDIGGTQTQIMVDNSTTGGFGMGGMFGGRGQGGMWGGQGGRGDWFSGEQTAPENTVHPQDVPEPLQSDTHQEELPELPGGEIAPPAGMEPQEGEPAQAPGGDFMPSEETAPRQNEMPDGNFELPEGMKDWQGGMFGGRGGMPGGDFEPLEGEDWRGGMKGDNGEMPDGMFGGRGGMRGGDGEVPDGIDPQRGGMPGGDFQGPNGGFQRGEGPGMPGGTPQDGSVEVPDNPVPQSDAPQPTESGIPDVPGWQEDFDPNQMFGQMRGQKGNTNRASGQLRDWVQQQETQVVADTQQQRETMILMGASALFLLAGLLVAWKTRH